MRRAVMERKNLLAFAIFVLLVATLSMYHEPWRDEVDAWLIARDRSVGEILRLGAYTGTPALWYLMQAPFAKVGASYEAQRYLHLVVVSLAAALVLFRAPFAFALRVVLVFGYFFSFEYAVIARNYSAGILCCFSALAMDRQRVRLAPFYGLAIGLAANASAHFTFFALALSVPFAWDTLLLRGNRRVWLGFGLCLAGIGLAIWQLWPAPDGQVPADFFVSFAPVQIRRTLAHAFVPKVDSIWAVAVGVLAVGVASARLRSSPRAAVVFLLCSLGLTYIFVFKFVTGIRHYGLFLIAMIIALWMAEETPPDAVMAKPLVSLRAFTAAMFVLLLPSVAMAVRSWRIEVKYAFSEAADMASFIRAQRLDQARIAAHQPFPTVLGFLPRRTLWYPSVGEEGSHSRYNSDFARSWEMSVEEAVARMKVQCPEWDNPVDPVLLLLTKPLAAPTEEGFRLLYRTPGRPWGDVYEQFYLYAPTAWTGDELVRSTGTRPKGWAVLACRRVN
jgi:hypothetical protein